MDPDFSLYRRIFVKALNSELSTEQYLRAQVIDDTHHSFDFFETALFNTAVKHHFHDDSSIESVLAFVDTVGEHYDADDRFSDFKPFITEGLIRSVLHDGLILFELFPNADIQGLKFPVIWKISQASPDFLTRIEYFMDLAQMQAQEWLDAED